MNSINLLLVGRSQTVQDWKRLCWSIAGWSGVDVISRQALEDVQPLLHERSKTVAILILWEEPDWQPLLDWLDQLQDRHSGIAPEVLIRTPLALSAELGDALWELGVWDRDFDCWQDPRCVEALRIVLRSHHRQQRAQALMDSGGRLAQAETLYQLALDALLLLHEQGLGRRGGLFCFRRQDLIPEWLVVAGTGVHASAQCERVGALPPFEGRALLLDALEGDVPLYSGCAAAFPLVSRRSGQRTVLYLQLEQSLSPWERGLIGNYLNTVVALIDETQLAMQLRRTQQATIMTLAMVAEYRDADTGAHLSRVARLSTEIAQVLVNRGVAGEAGESLLAHIGHASILHDLGKVNIPEALLQKPGPLTADERVIMQQHTVYGFEVLDKAGLMTQQGDAEILGLAAQIARWHHERFDGQGYPDGLEGDQIPLMARIVAVVDVYDALISARPYKQPWPEEKAVELIVNGAGTQFDPQVVDAFVELRQRKADVVSIVWSNGMSVRHEQLDEDHRYLFSLFNQLAAANALGNRQVIELILEELEEYTISHFRREEQVMRDLGYPDYERHCRIHSALTSRVQDVKWEYAQGIRETIQAELMDFMTNWLYEHILQEDLGYAEHFQIWD